MARMPDLERFARAHDLRILGIADLIGYRQNERQIRRRAETRAADAQGGELSPAWSTATTWKPQAFVALVKGEIKPDRRRWCGCIRSA